MQEQSALEEKVYSSAVYDLRVTQNTAHPEDFSGLDSDGSICCGALRGLIYEKIEGNGHCLFNAAVALYVGQNQQTLRNLVVARIRRDAELQSLLPLAHGQTIERYLQDMLAGREWADQVEISVLMTLLDRPIIIIRSNSNPVIPHNVSKYQGDPIFVYYNGHDHYDALLLGKERTAGEILAEIQDYMSKGKRVIYRPPLDHVAYTKASYMLWVFQGYSAYNNAHMLWKISYVLSPALYIKTVVQTLVPIIERYLPDKARVYTQYIPELLAAMANPTGTVLSGLATRLLFWLTDKVVVKRLLRDLPRDPKQATYAQIELYGFLKMAQSLVAQWSMGLLKNPINVAASAGNRFFAKIPGAGATQYIADVADRGSTAAINGSLKYFFPKLNTEISVMRSLNPQHPSFQHQDASVQKRLHLDKLTLMHKRLGSVLENLQGEMTLLQQSIKSNQDALLFLNHYRNSRLSPSAKYVPPNQPIPAELDGIQEKNLSLQDIEKLIAEYQQKNAMDMKKRDELALKREDAQKEYQQVVNAQQQAEVGYAEAKRDFEHYANEYQQEQFSKWEENKLAREAAAIKSLLEDEARQKNGNLLVNIPLEELQKAFDDAARAQGILGSPVKDKDVTYTINAITLSTNADGSLAANCKIRVDRMHVGGAGRIQGFDAEVTFSVHVEDSALTLDDLSGHATHKVKISIAGGTVFTATGEANKILQGILDTKSSVIEQQLNHAVKGALHEVAQQHLGNDGRIDWLTLKTHDQAVGFELDASGNFQIRLEYTDLAKGILGELYASDLPASYSYHIDGNNITLCAEYSNGAFLQVRSPIHYSSDVLTLSHVAIETNIPDVSLQSISMALRLSDLFGNDFGISQHINSDFIAKQIDVVGVERIFPNGGSFSLDSERINVRKIEFQPSYINLGGRITPTSSPRFGR